MTTPIPALRRLSGTMLLPVLLSILSGTAVAHTGLHKSVPADGATVAAAPGAIDLEFHGEVRLIRLAPSQEGSAVVASFTPASAPAARYSVPVQGLRSGIVTVAWAAIGEDGHTVTGSFTFTIAPGGPEIAAP